MDIKDTSLYDTSQMWRPAVEHYWNKEIIIWTVMLLDKKQDKHCTYNVILWRHRITNHSAVETQKCILRVLSS